jgi:hypothetical protein
MRLKAVLPLLALALVGLPVPPLAAQTSLVPYYGKNNIHYDKFKWQHYETDHFIIYFYPELQQHLERIASYAESAYQQISSDLKHEIPTKVSLILYKTHSEFEQENVAPGEATEGVGAFAEPLRQRMLMPIDAPSDQLYGLIVHELTHQFEFDILPVSLLRRNVPLWVNEGLSEYERGQWAPLDLMMVRDAAIADIVPKMTETEDYGNASSARFVPYNLGHAVFEFIEAKAGKEGIRQFLFALRKNAIGGGDDAYEEGLRMKKDEFDQAFDRYLKERFKPFRDKERPADYGRDLSPNKEKTHFTQAFSIAPSPSGDLIAAVTVNRKDREYDIVLLSSKDGSIVRNLTSGFDKDRGWDHVVLLGDRFEMPWLAWSPKGDRIAYFVRTEKERSLIIQNVLTTKAEVRVPMKSVDEPESPNFSPDGRTIAFAALRNGIGDIYTVDLETKQLTNLTSDEFADAAPVYSPDGKYLIYNARISGNQKLFRVDLDTKKKTQITFGTVDETAAQFIDDHTIVFSSTATDPNLPIEPEVAKNGNIYNIWTLDLTNGEMRQYSDTLGGNWSAVVLNEGKNKRIAFVTYYKGDFGIHTLERQEPLHTASTSDFGSPGPIVDFQPPLEQKIVASKIEKKGTFEKMFLEGRPPINVGVTSGGDVFGGTQITFGDVLGDQQFNFFAASVAQYRTFALGYVNLSQRMQWAVQGYSQEQFFYGNLSGLLYDPALAPLISRDDAIATRSVYGATGFAIYPFTRYNRLEMSAGLLHLSESYNDPTLQASSVAYQQTTYGQQIFSDGTMIPFGVAFVQETTVFREYGPLAGSTMKLGYTVAPKIAGSLSRQTFDIDLRHYLRIGTNGTFATRFRFFKSSGDFPDFTYFGGNSEMRGYDYLQFTGQNAFFANAELRFPIIEAALTPIGVVGGVRGVFFADIGGASFNNQPSAVTSCAGLPNGYAFASSKNTVCLPVIGNVIDPVTGFPVPDPHSLNPDGTCGATCVPLLQYGNPIAVNGFRLQDGRASYGIGLETFAFGFPIHFDWAWRTLFNTAWENVVFAPAGGSSAFRRAQFAVWIGYDF